MADTNDTIDGLLAEMRKDKRVDSNLMWDNSQVEEHDLHYADRLDAAHRRERGDAAKLRKALETARLFVTNCPTPLTTPLVGCGMSRAEVMNIIDAALSAPPRNCDLPEVAKDPWRAWLDDKSNWDEFGSPKLEIHDWLLAPATEKEGGAK